MKLLLTPVEQAEAINDWIMSNYGIPLEVSQDTFTDIAIETKPVLTTRVYEELKAAAESLQKDYIPNDGYSDDTLYTKMLEEDERVEREAAIVRAEELGISYHPNIGTDNLIKRIEEHEEEMVEQVRTPDPLPMDNETEVVQDFEQEVIEDVAAKPKNSIFNRGEQRA